MGNGLFIVAPFWLLFGADQVVKLVRNGHETAMKSDQAVQAY